MRRQLVTAVRALLLLTVIAGLLFPLVMTGVAQVVFRDRANGSLIHRGSTVVGSSLLGQAFTGDEYFHPRPSAAGEAATGADRAADPNALSLVSSGASNLGPTNPDLVAAVEERVNDYRDTNGLSADTPVPIDAVTASGSGLDPHISVANAQLQARRVATARSVPVDDVLGLLADATTRRSLGVLGNEGVNVLRLNLLLDERLTSR